jgi:hypothetical protein
MTTHAAPPAPVSSWDHDEKQAARRMDPVLIGAAGLAVAAIVVGFIANVIVLGLVIAALLVAAGVWWSTSAPARALKSIGARPVGAGEQPRLMNMVAGLSTDLSIPVPAVCVLEGGGPNAFVIGGRKPRLGVTTSLLDTYTRTELEAVIAHCLGRIVSAGRGTVGPIHLGDDIRAAALTRYPPALASAFRKAIPQSDRGGARWFVPAEGAADAEDRALEVLDL